MWQERHGSRDMAGGTRAPPVPPRLQKHRGVKDTLGEACWGCRRDGGTKGIRSLLPHTPPKMWLGQGWRCGGGEGSWPAPQRLGGLSLGCCCPLSHTSCLHAVGFSSKEGSRLAGVPEGEASVTTRVTADAAAVPARSRHCCALWWCEPMMKCPLSCACFWPGGGIVRSLMKQGGRQATPREVAGLGWDSQGTGGCCPGSCHGEPSGS